MANKKYFVKGTSHEMKLGDDVNMFGIQTKMTQEMLDAFVQQGLFEVKEMKYPVKDVDYYVNKFRNRIKFGNHPMMMQLIINIGDACPMVLFGILLKEIALDLDKTHQGNIRNNGMGFFVSNADFKVYPIQLTKDTCISGFSVFWTKEEAEAALEVLNPLVETILNGK